ncbi:MAG TPA: molecular chaperone HscC [Leptospiraceae bacterium]|nr:molecular chaperone HscC [Leptospiraceae bacterium]HMW05405.1 molecular chaperone HscC [Leptospiraceae bacterium]HMX32849.1 molecular chaperone HscC [Leptospiraceae bacterium]HMY33889.1 molecular chaperone HscC [Leptospiraceae bacterium]HMZ64507.1 molecular chaperone HscC [Leptospiraceae bacterium]
MIIGIDLGTTNSLVSVFQDGKSVLIPNSLGSFLTPSVVSMTEKDEVLVGLSARERLSTHSNLTASVFKRYMGTNKEIFLGRKKYRAEELSSLVLRSLKRDAEVFLGEKIEKAIITVPAYFSDAQRKATRIAGELAGLSVEGLLNEPTAAALAYGLHELADESKFLVFDLGGGTFDVSILDLFEGVMEVRASTGDNFLGGEDFRNCIVDRFVERVVRKEKLPEEDQKLIGIIRNQAEIAKRALTESNRVEMKVNWKDTTYTMPITSDEFSEWTEPLLARLRKPVERALRDSKIKASDLNQIVLAGGATRMPSIKKLVAKMFGILPASSLNPDEIVALGAGVQAGLKMKNSALKEIVLTDVCPYTLGIEVSERVGNDYKSGFYMPIIERNTIVPVSRSEVVNCVEDNQKVMRVRIYQGEARLVKDNIFLGEVAVRFPPLPASEASADVRFTYDINGILEVEVHVHASGEKYRSVIEENPGVLTPKEIEEKLKSLSNLKIHPREKEENRALLSRAERLYEESLGNIRRYIGEEMTLFISALDSQDEEKIGKAKERIVYVLNDLEGNNLF